MRRTVWALLLAFALLSLSLDAQAAGLITGLTASVNPAPVNTDVTFIVKGTGGGCSDLTVDFGDGQTTQLVGVSFNNNTNTSAPPHKYSVASTYAVKAIPGKSCTGAASVSLTVTASGGGASTQGGRYLSKSLKVRAGSVARYFTPTISNVFPFSVIKPGGGVIVQGTNFGASPGHFKLHLQNGLVTDLGNLTWQNDAVSGIIDPGITGVLDQPATLQVVDSRGTPSEEVPVQFTARREIALVVGHPDSVECLAAPADEGSMGIETYPSITCFFNHDAGDYPWSDSDAGTDHVRLHLRNGWVVDHAVVDRPIGSVATPSEGGTPSEPDLAIAWDTASSSSGLFCMYNLFAYVLGPAGTTYY